MKRKKRKTRKNLAPAFQTWLPDESESTKPDNVTKEFTGARRKIIDRLPVTEMPKSLLLVGYLEELIGETPDESSVNMTKWVNNICGKKPFVCASGDGKLVVIISPDTRIQKNVNPSAIEEKEQLDKAIGLHTDFHGVEPKTVKKVGTGEVDHLVFCGWLNHIIYSVPKYSERRGVPFIHEARDKGENVPKSKEKPLVCISPSRDMIILFGKEMSFTDRGIIG